VRPNLRSLATPKVRNIIGDADGMSAKAMLARMPQTSADLDALRAAIANNPIYDGVLISKDRRTAAIVAEFKADGLGFGAIRDHVMAAIAPFKDGTVTFMVTGQPIFLAALEKYSDRMGFLLPIAIVVIGLLHFEAFRTVQGLVLPLVTALLAVVWGIGIMTIVGMQLDPFSNITPILIIAVAAGHAVQILKRYYESYGHFIREETEPRIASEKAVIEAVTAIGPVMVAAGFVACMSFLSLLIFDIQSIRTFGTFAALGVASALVIELTFIPAVRAMLPPPSLKTVNREHATTAWDRMVMALAGLVLGPRRGLVIGAGVVVALAAIFGTSLIHYDNSLRAFFTTDQQHRIDDAAMNERLAGTNTLYVLIEGQGEDAMKEPAVLKAMLATQALLAKDPLVGATISIADFVARMNRAMNGDDPKFATIPDSNALVSQYLLLYAMSGDQGDFNVYVDPGYRNAVIQAFVKTDSSAHVAALERQLTPFVHQAFPPDVRVRLAGSITTPTAMSDMIVSGKIQNIASIAAVVFVIGSLMFRSMLAGLLLLVPLAMSGLVNFGLMGFTGIPLQIATATVAALAIGVGADYAIYFTYRLRDEIRQGHAFDEAVRRTYATAGKATLYVATAVGGGYATLIFSYGFNIHLWLGTMIALAMIVSALSALTLYPALLLRLKPRFVFGGAPITKAVPATLVVLVAALGLATHQPARAEEIDATEIMRKNYAVTHFPDSSLEATFTLTEPNGETRVRKATGITKSDSQESGTKRLTRFVQPADIEGLTILSHENVGRDDDIWVYLPAMRKTRRLAAGDKRDSFAGTDFSHGDVIGYKVDEWNHRFVKREKFRDADCAVIESIPKDDTVKANTGYGKRLTWVRLDNFIIVKARLYDENNKILKVFKTKRLKQVDAKANLWQPMYMDMKNEQTGHRSVIEYTKYEVNTGVDDAKFSPTSLDAGD
jgi:predicted RND superfamily exporter protein